MTKLSQYSKCPCQEIFVSVMSDDESVDLLAALTWAAVFVRTVRTDVTRYRLAKLFGRGLRHDYVITTGTKVRVYRMLPNSSPKKIWAVS